MDNMVDDHAMNLQMPVAFPHFTTLIVEKYFVKELDQWAKGCNNERCYQYQAYRHSGGGIFIGYTFVEAFDITVCGRKSFYIPLLRDLC